MDEDTAAAILAALASPTRLSILRYLVRRGPAGAPASDIAAAIAASPSRASFHFRALTDTGILTSERQAREVRYRVAFDRLGGLLSWLVEDCCAGEPKLRSCCARP